MALVHYDTLKDEDAKNVIAQLTAGYADKTEYFVDRLAHGLARIAAAYHPKPVIVRTSDFKTNEYANLIGGSAFEPKEENPMIGFRGASRYYLQPSRSPKASTASPLAAMTSPSSRSASIAIPRS
jgi:pyruvate,water dikinase